MAFLVPALKSAKIPLEEELLTRVRSSFTLSRPCFRLTYDKIVSRIAIISQVNSSSLSKHYISQNQFKKPKRRVLMSMCSSNLFIIF